MRTSPKGAPNRAAASGLSFGPRERARHPEKAVRRALERAGLSRANAVLLFLTPDYATDPAPALRAAARAANCLQVFGCTAPGLITEEEWLLDSPSAAALVLGGSYHLRPPAQRDHDSLVISLSTSDGLSAEWLDQPVPRLGIVASDISGHGAFAVWNGARVIPAQHTHACLTGARATAHAARGVRALTAPLAVADVQGFELKRLGNYPAFSVLVQSLPAGLREREAIPLHMLMYGVVFGDPTNAIREGRFRLDPIIAANAREHSVTLSESLRPGDRLFWAIRDQLAAERDMIAATEQAHSELRDDPAFALLFSSVMRGPSFYGNRDRDLETLRRRFPGMPIIGCYGNGEIAPLGAGSHLHQHSTAFALFR
jgi:small ligand-binding sensory domain FIST